MKVKTVAIELTAVEESRFWEKVDQGEPNDCWNWTAATNSKGYGSFGVRRKTCSSHRVSYTLANGPITDGLLIRHKCDNRLCVNPGHLELGTHADNSQDAVDRRRSTYGERNGRASLTEDDVVEMRRSARSGTSLISIARTHSCDPTTAYDAVRGRSWKHITEPPVLTTRPRTKRATADSIEVEGNG